MARFSNPPPSHRTLEDKWMRRQGKNSHAMLFGVFDKQSCRRMAWPFRVAIFLPPQWSVHYRLDWKVRNRKSRTPRELKHERWQASAPSLSAPRMATTTSTMRITSFELEATHS